jgi:putative glutamine amidotransferase
MKPLIGITPDYEPGKKIKTRLKKEGVVYLWDRYIQAVADNRGLPVVLPILDDEESISDLAQTLDGLMLAGGPFDIHPKHYGEKPVKELGETRENRTRFELAITREALELDLPVLGICGGMQAINVALGGSLFQDIKKQVPKAIPHEQKKPRNEPAHRVIIGQGTLLSRIMFERKEGRDRTAQVNSTHHQAVKETGKGLLICAAAPDGVVEGIESPSHTFVLGVQWHPELLYPRMKEQRGIFEAFVQAAGKRRE